MSAFSESHVERYTEHNTDLTGILAPRNTGDGVRDGADR